MLLRIAFSASENADNDQIFHDVGIQNFEVIYEEQVMAHIQNHKNTTSKHKNFSIFSLILREIDAEKSMLIKRVFSQRKRRK
jgi:hypothetical protein